MALMSSGSFPFPLLGLVHLDDAITQHRPIAIGEPLDFEVRAADLRRHPKGTAFSLRRRGRASGGELVWEETRHDPPPRRRRSRRARAPTDPSRSGAGRPAGLGVAAARRPRPPLRGRLRRPQPDPPASADRPRLRIPAADRPRDVEHGPLPRPARGPAPGRLHAASVHVPPAGAAAGTGPVRGSRRAADRRASAFAASRLRGGLDVQERNIARPRGRSGKRPEIRSPITARPAGRSFASPSPGGPRRVSGVAMHWEPLMQMPRARTRLRAAMRPGVQNGAASPAPAHRVTQDPLQVC